MYRYQLRVRRVVPCQRIPAREMFGIRLGASRKLGNYSKKAFGSADEQGVAKVSGGQHCRAMFWLAGFGWLPADPADVTKMRLAEKKKTAMPPLKPSTITCSATGK